MGKRLGITSIDGPVWHEQRRFVVSHLRHIGYGKSRMTCEIQNETLEILKYIDNNKELPIQLGASDFLATNVINILWTFTTGEKIERSNERLKSFLVLMKKRTEAFDINGGLLNQMPWLRFIIPELSGFNLINNLNKQLKIFFTEIIDRHVLSFSVDKANDDLIYAFINEMSTQKDNKNSTFTFDQLTMIILDIFFAGAQLTSVGIDLVLMIMIIYPEIQKKVHEELAHFENLPDYSRRHDYPYLQAVINETLRFFTFFPVGGPRRTLQETTLGGYKLPKHTTVLLGLKHVHMDASYWKDPEVFRPERFIEQNATQRLVTFAFGKRRCLGDQLAKECIFNFVAGILKNFSLHECDEALPSLKLTPGLSLTPKPFKVIFKKL
jgi:Cytochrome P450